MTPMLASMLEQMENQPSALSSHVISHATSMAISHIRLLEAALEDIATPERLITYGDPSVLRNRAKDALTLKEQKDAAREDNGSVAR